MKFDRITLVLIIISSLYLILSSLNIATSFPLERGDNYYNIISAKGILEYNLKPIGDFDIFQNRSEVTLNHPPLYNYLLAFFLFVFKFSLSLNFVNIIMNLLSAFLLIKICKSIFKNIKNSTLIILFFLFLFIPLIIQASYLVDIDSMLGLVILLFVYFYLKNPKKIFLNSFLFMVIWFTKIEGIPIVVLSLFLYLILAKKQKKDYLNTFLIILIGTFLFFIILFFYGNYFDVDISRMFKHSSIVDIIKTQISNPIRTFLTSLWTAKLLLIWLVPSLLILYFSSIYTYVKEKKWRENKEIILPILISLITFLMLIPIGTYGWNFPRNYVILVPFMFLTMIPLIENIKFQKKDFCKILILLFITVSYFLLIPDPYIPEASETFIQKEYFPIIMKILLNIILISLPILFVFFLYKKNEIFKIFLISSFVIFISVNIMQITKPYSTNNIYGDSHKDLQATLGYLKKNTNSTDKLLLFAHVGYYFGNEDNTNWYNSMLCYNSYDCMINITSNKEIKFMQFYPKDLKRINGKLKEIVEREFEYDKNFGNYIIYKRKTRID